MKNFFPSRTVSCVFLFCSFNLKVRPYNKSFIDQACSVKMAGYWPRSFSLRSIKTQKKRTWQISSHLDRTSLVNNAYLSSAFIVFIPTHLLGKNKLCCRHVKGRVEQGKETQRSSLGENFSNPQLLITPRHK